MQFLRLTLRPAGCFGIGRPQQRTASLWLVTVLTRPIARRTTVQTSDFGQSPILVSLHNGQRVLVVGQKSGVVHALDPDQEGKILWQTRIGKGGPLGGIMWGSAADQDRVYVANSDLRFFATDEASQTRTQAEACSGWTLPPGKSRCRCRRSRVVTAANAALPFPQRSPKFPVLSFRAGLAAIYAPMPLRDAKLLWESRHGARLRDGEWRFGTWRCHGRTRADDRGRHALRKFGLRPMGRSAWQRLAGLRSQETLIRRDRKVAGTG